MLSCPHHQLINITSTTTTMTRTITRTTANATTATVTATPTGEQQPWHHLPCQALGSMYEYFYLQARRYQQHITQVAVADKRSTAERRLPRTDCNTPSHLHHGRTGPTGHGDKRFGPNCCVISRLHFPAKCIKRNHEGLSAPSARQTHVNRCAEPGRPIAPKQWLEPKRLEQPNLANRPPNGGFRK